MFKLFKKKRKSFINPVKVDMHSHLIPGVDDGVKDFEESITIIKKFLSLGYKKLITTPHIMKEFYDNSWDTLAEPFHELKKLLYEQRIPMEIELGAEYHIDEFFIEKLDRNEKMLTFGDNHILVETSFYNAPVFLKDVLFELMTKGYNPIFAHPERYFYLAQNSNLLNELKDMQILFQINISSLQGYYGKHAKKIAEKIVENGWVDFVGSDCHNIGHVDALEKTIRSKSYQSIEFKNIQNNRFFRR